MNGRAYDPELGRFTGVDPFMQAPLNSQSLNPYSYVMNNPIAGTDPTGYKCMAGDNSSMIECGDGPFGGGHQPFGPDFGCKRLCKFDSGAESPPTTASSTPSNTTDIGSLNNRPSQEASFLDGWGRAA